MMLLRRKKAKVSAHTVMKTSDYSNHPPGRSNDVMVIKSGQQTIVNEFDSHWVSYMTFCYI